MQNESSKCSIDDHILVKFDYFLEGKSTLIAEPHDNIIVIICT